MRRWLAADRNQRELTAQANFLPAASAAAMRARLSAVASSRTISIAAAIGTPMIAPTIPIRVPNSRTLTITVKPETLVALPTIVGYRM
jgi:hypothetical protein